MSAFGTVLMTLGLLSMVVRVLLSLGSVSSNSGGMLLSGTDVVSIVLVGAGLGVTLFSTHIVNEVNGLDTEPTHEDNEGVALKARLLDMLARKKTISGQDASVSEPAQEVILRGDSPSSQTEGLSWESPLPEITSFPESPAEQRPSDVVERPLSPPSPPAPTVQPPEASTDKKESEADAAKAEVQVNQEIPSTPVDQSRKEVTSTGGTARSRTRNNRRRPRQHLSAAKRFQRKPRLPRRSSPRARVNSRYRNAKRTTRRNLRGGHIGTRVSPTPTRKVPSTKKRLASRTSRIQRRSKRSSPKTRVHYHPKTSSTSKARASRTRRATRRHKVASKHSKPRRPVKLTLRTKHPRRSRRSKGRSKRSRELHRRRRAT